MLDKRASFELFKHNNPFSQVAAPSYPYVSSSFREALGVLYYGLERGNRVLILSGERGLGKTTLLRLFERRARERGRTLFFSPAKDGSELLRKLLNEIGCTAPGDDLPTMELRIDEILLRTANVENPFILLLDYDQDAEHSAVETMRCLTSLESVKRGLLRIVTAGSADTAKKLQDSEFGNEIRCATLSPLMPVEVEPYIDYRLRLTGWRGPQLFATDACALIAERSSGRPGVINEICLNLLQGLTENQCRGSDGPASNEVSIIDQDHVRSVRSGHDELIPVHALLYKRRIASSACAVLAIVLAVAGLWYHRSIKSYGAQQLTAEIHARSGAPFHHPARPLTNAVHFFALRGINADGKRLVANAGSETASPGLDEGTSPKIGSPAPSVVASPTTANEGTRDVAAVPLTNQGARVLASPTTTVQKEARGSAEAVTKKDQQSLSVPLSGTVLVGRTKTSSPAPQEPTATDTSAARSLTIDAGRVSKLSAADQDKADFEIRLGDTYMKHGDYDQALRSFSRAASLQPSNKEAKERFERARRAKLVEEDISR